MTNDQEIKPQIPASACVRLYSPKALQAVLDLSRAKINYLLTRGTKDRPPLPSIRIGGSVRVREDQLADWLRTMPTK